MDYKKETYKLRREVTKLNDVTEAQKKDIELLMKQREKLKKMAETYGTETYEWKKKALIYEDKIKVLETELDGFKKTKV